MLAVMNLWFATTGKNKPANGINGLGLIFIAGARLDETTMEVTCITSFIG